VLIHQTMSRLTHAFEFFFSEWPNNERIAVGTDFEFRIFGDIKKLKNWPLNNQAKAVPDGTKCFDHSLNVITNV